jgi:hypothetical protein
MAASAYLDEARRSYHAALVQTVLRTDRAGVPSNADKDSPASVKIARGIAIRLGFHARGSRLAAQMSGKKFEEVTYKFIEQTFPKLSHLRPGDWEVKHITGRYRLEIARYEQYAHLVALEKAASENPELAAALGSDYTITPDIIVVRNPEKDSVINAPRIFVNEAVCRLASLRKSNLGLPLLHASISCKWTLRSDRAQNARSEALNLIRNRKGPLPHVTVVTGEPLPSRLASIALGTGDIDCVYHFALTELKETVADEQLADSREMLHIMVSGRRLKDISDLPLDLAI